MVPKLALERASDPEDLAALLGPRARVAPDLGAALQGEVKTLVCGSLYLVGAYYELHPEHLEP